MTRAPILLVRHTEAATANTLTGWTDVSLSAAGEAAIAPLARFLALRRPSRVFSSDLRRCRRLAEAIAREAELPPPDYRPALREEAFGRWEAKTWDELLASPERELAQAFLEDFVERAPTGGESFGAMGARILAEFRLIQAEATGKRPIVVVTHAGPMRILRCATFGVSFQRAFDFDVPFGAVFEV